MEAVGAVASLVALGPVALQTFSQARKLYSEAHNAPAELSQLVEHLGILDCELSLLLDLEKRAITGDDFPLVGNEAIQVQQALQSAHNILQDIGQSLLSFRKVSVGKRDRLSWMIKGKAEAEELFKGLERTNASLSAVLQLLNVRISFYTFRLVSQLSQSHEKKVALGAQQRLPSSGRITGLLNRNPQFHNILRSSWRTLHSSWLAWLGIHIILTSYQNDLQTTSHLTVRLDPLSGMFSRWDVFLHLKLRFLINNTGFQVLGGGLSCRNIIPEDSPVINACKQGDVVTLRNLLSSRKATLNDTAPNNCGPITYAIEGGSLETVQLLCSVGANVNAPFGKFQTSPLEWAFHKRQLEIARFLLTCGAEIDYLCARGWTPVQHLYWPWKAPLTGSKKTLAPSSHFLSMLCAQSFSEFNTQDAAGAAAIHRAASWGSAEDVRSLLHVGASPSVRTLGQGWTPAFNAASCNNIGALRELAACQSAGFLGDVDNAGRTILHVALDAKSADAVRFVLAQGSDPHALLPEVSCAKGTHLSTSADCNHSGGRVSAVELACRMGGDVYAAFMDGLVEAGYDVTISAQDEVEGVFWPAEEAL